ncbi:MAG: BrnA antitoxin family protein [Phenylobacterium sp.]|nr:BrnA antitoxin family protein [Phenylobacterium sp.]
MPLTPGPAVPRSAKIGQPKLESPKKQIPLRLAQMVIDRFRALGPGWQAATCWPTPYRRTGRHARHARPLRGSVDRLSLPSAQPRWGETCRVRNASRRAGASACVTDGLGAPRSWSPCSPSWPSAWRWNCARRLKRWPARRLRRSPRGSRRLPAAG